MLKLFRRYFISLLALSLALAPLPSFAQVSNVNTFPGQNATYQAGTIALAPAAATTDFFTITGVANRQIRVRYIHCDGTSTAAATFIVQVVKRSTADTAGTATTLTDVPLNSLVVAGVGVVRAYTANPTLGTAIGVIATDALTTNTVASSAFDNQGMNLNFNDQRVYLNSAAEVLALNANGATLSAGTSLNCWAQWSE